MRPIRVLAMAAAITALSLPAAAQHGPTNAHIPSGAGVGHSQGTSPHGSDTDDHGASSTHGSSASTHGSSGDHSHHSSSTTNGTTTTTTTNSIANSISQNPKQLARVDKLLPAGMTLDDASAGFRNRGQFIAALEVSKNRGIPFADLKNAMTQDGLSLGEAVRKLQPQTKTPDNDEDQAPTTGTTTSTSTK